MKVSVSGDGLFHEVLNGLASRNDWEKVLSLKRKESTKILASGKKIPMFSWQPKKHDSASRKKYSKFSFGESWPLVWSQVGVGTQCIAVFCISWPKVLMMR